MTTGSLTSNSLHWSFIYFIIFYNVWAITYLDNVLYLLHDHVATTVYVLLYSSLSMIKHISSFGFTENEEHSISLLPLKIKLAFAKSNAVREYILQLKIIIWIYLEAIVNFEWTYHLTVCNSRPYHDGALFIKNSTSGPAITSSQTRHTFIMKNYCWEMMYFYPCICRLLLTRLTSGRGYVAYISSTNVLNNQPSLVLQNQLQILSHLSSHFFLLISLFFRSLLWNNQNQFISVTVQVFFK